MHGEGGRLWPSITSDGPHPIILGALTVAPEDTNEITSAPHDLLVVERSGFRAGANGSGFRGAALGGGLRAAGWAGRPIGGAVPAGPPGAADGAGGGAGARDGVGQSLPV
jgi:hypothetical protein